MIETPITPTQIAPDMMMTAEAFEQFVLLPENRDRNFEWYSGRVVEVVSNGLSSEWGAFFIIKMGGFVVDNKLGRVTNSEGGYMVNGNRLIPDAVFMSFARQRKNPGLAYNPLAPDLAIEVLSPTDRAKNVSTKIQHYMLAGTVVWLVDPEDETVEVYVPGQSPRLLLKTDTLTGEPVLPGFTLLLSEVFDYGAPEDDLETHP